MAKLRVFSITGFDGHWPVPTAAVVLAESPEQAAELLAPKLEAKGLGLGLTPCIQEVTPEEPVLIQSTGDY